MKRLLLLAWFVTVPAFAQDDLASRIDAIFADYAKPDSPGCIVGVSRGGNAVYEHGYGMADLEHDVPLTPATISEAGSVSKQFTAAAIMLLAKDGKLSIEEKARKYIPELPDSAAEVTVRELLNHTNGIRDWGPVVALGGWPRETRTTTHAHVLDVIAHQRELNFVPGTQWSYNTGGYNLLAIIVERVSGKSFADFTRERIFVPLGMTHSSWHDDVSRVVKGRAGAYSKQGGAWHIDNDLENVYGNCCLLTTVGDLLRWNTAGREMQKPLETPAVLAGGIKTNYGFGLFIGNDEIYHSGATAGYRAFLTRHINDDVSIALLCNRGDAPTAALAEKVAAAIDIQQQSPRPAKRGEGGRRPGEGLYIDPKTNAILRITDKTALPPTVELRVEPDGLHLVTIYKPEAVYVKVPQAAPTPEQLNEYAKTYVSDEADATWVFSVTNGKLVAKILPARSFTLEPTYADGFQTPDGDLVHFTRDAAGHVDGFDVKAEFSMPLGSARVERLHFQLHP